jgi:glycyl-tRNA synthetase alpha subunit
MKAEPLTLLLEHINSLALSLADEHSNHELTYNALEEEIKNFYVLYSLPEYKHCDYSAEIKNLAVLLKTHQENLQQLQSVIKQEIINYQTTARPIRNYLTNMYGHRNEEIDA